MNIEKIKKEHKVFKEWSYDLGAIDRGYNNRTLYINVGNNEILEKPVSQQMKEKFIGGKGFGLKMLWEGTKADTAWNDPDNEIIISGGPICGITQY